MKSIYEFQVEKYATKKVEVVDKEETEVLDEGKIHKNESTKMDVVVKRNKKVTNDVTNDVCIDRKVGKKEGDATKKKVGHKEGILSQRYFLHL